MTRRKPSQSWSRSFVRQTGWSSIWGRCTSWSRSPYSRLSSYTWSSPNTSCRVLPSEVWRVKKCGSHTERWHCDKLQLLKDGKAQVSDEPGREHSLEQNTWNSFLPCFSSHSVSLPRFDNPQEVSDKLQTMSELPSVPQGTHESSKIVCGLRTSPRGVFKTWKDTDHRRWQTRQN